MICCWVAIKRHAHVILPPSVKVRKHCEEDDTSVEPHCSIDICARSARPAGHTRQNLHRNQSGVSDVHRLRSGLIKACLSQAAEGTSCTSVRNSIMSTMSWSVRQLACARRSNQPPTSIVAICASRSKTSPSMSAAPDFSAFFCCRCSSMSFAMYVVRMSQDSSVPSPRSRSLLFTAPGPSSVVGPCRSLDAKYSAPDWQRHASCVES